MRFDPDLHQVVALEHMRENPRCALFLGMGISKTASVLMRLDEMIYTECEASKVLIIAPDKVARVTWPDEIDKWDEFRHMRYSIVSGDSKKRKKALQADADIYMVGVDNIEWLIGELRGVWPFECVVFDELSLFKNHRSKRFKILRKAIKGNSPYRIGMTGTPSTQGYTDLWAEFALIDDGVRLGESFAKYVDAWFTTRGNGQIVYEYKPRPNALKSISRLISDITLSMNTKDHVKLPPLNLVDDKINFDPFDMELYSSLEEEAFLELEGGEVVLPKTASELVGKLIQLSGGAIYDEFGNWYELNTAKMDALRRWVNTGRRMIVVYQFRHEVERILRDFPQARVFRRGAKTREDVAEWNAGRIGMLLMHPASGGHGLNLQEGGNLMIFFSPTYNLEHYLQVIARLHRRGAKGAVDVIRLMVGKTIDGKVYKRLDSKDVSQKSLLKTINEWRNTVIQKVKTPGKSI